MYMKFFNTAGLKKTKRWPFTPSVVTPSCTAARSKDSRTRVVHTPATNSTVNVILSELLMSSLAMQQLSFRAPRSWITWNPRTLRYGEYKHTGTGSLRKGRQLVRKRLRLLSKGLSKGLPKLDERSFPYWFGPDDQKSLLTCQWIPNVTVASDGTGDFLTISEAVVKVPETGNSKFVIHVKGGLYRENMILPPKKSNVVMFGDGNTKTIVSAGLNRLDNPLFTTFQTATISVRGRGFVAMDMKFVNTA
ncbi:unnamed protein product [Brassica rapa]|uniref:Pectinesterase catalytic domain-containing protein n=1 Tax=Brassica campestris TaxID=3711 RepID=A0A3P5ZH36_BRACM|nr:unnamed protein product [Brassica rapa]VDC77479.1 unnamed protein product [Brassica rapa]